MATVAEVLAEHAITSTEEEVAAELQVLLGPPAPAPSLSLTAAEDAFLAEHGGLRPASRKRLKALDARSSARALAEVAGTLSRSQAADALGIDETRLSHRARDGSIYVYPGAGGRPRYPDWQFRDGRVLPHLAEVLAALPEHVHPVTLRSFMTTPDDVLVLHDVPVSPSDWLTAGGPAEPVRVLAATLGEQA